MARCGLQFERLRLTPPSVQVFDLCLTVRFLQMNAFDMPPKDLDVTSAAWKAFTKVGGVHDMHIIALAQPRPVFDRCRPCSFVYL